MILWQSERYILRLFYPYYMVHAIFVFFCRPYNTLYLCPMLLSFVSWWKWSIVLFYFYAEGGELSWRWLCRHRWRRGCRFHNLRCRRWRQGRRRGGSLVSVSVFIVYYMYISHQSMTSPTNKSYCFLFFVSTLNKDFLSYLILMDK